MTNMALPVAPAVKIPDIGLFDVRNTKNSDPNLKKHQEVLKNLITDQSPDLSVEVYDTPFPRCPKYLASIIVQQPGKYPAKRYIFLMTWEEAINLPNNWKYEKIVIVVFDPRAGGPAYYKGWGVSNRDGGGFDITISCEPIIIQV